jgi:hypothetical protein
MPLALKRRLVQEPVRLHALAVPPQDGCLSVKLAGHPTLTVVLHQHLSLVMACPLGRPTGTKPRHIAHRAFPSLLPLRA